MTLDLYFNDEEVADLRVENRNRGTETEFEIKESKYSPISSASNSTSKAKDSHILVNMVDRYIKLIMHFFRTRNHVYKKTKFNKEHQSEGILTSLNSNDIDRYASKLSRSSEKTTHKEVYQNNLIDLQYVSSSLLKILFKPNQFG